MDLGSSPVRVCNNCETPIPEGATMCDECSRTSPLGRDERRAAAGLPIPSWRLATLEREIRERESEHQALADRLREAEERARLQEREAEERARQQEREAEDELIRSRISRS